MKRLKYIFIVLAAAAICGCSKDTTTTPSVNNEALQAFVVLNNIGIYQKNLPVYAFDKAQHQLVITPSTRTIRIQNDAGDQYAELKLSSIPKLGERAKGRFKSNLNKAELPDIELNNLLLIQSNDGKLWLWSDKEQLGFILPWEE